MITKEQAKEIREGISRVLEEYGNNNGLQISLPSLSYDNVSFSGRIKGVFADNKEDAEKAMWDHNCHLVGLSPEDYGRKVKIMGKEYRVVEIKTRSYKYRFIAEDIRTKKRYKIPTGSVNNWST